MKSFLALVRKDLILMLRAHVLWLALATVVMAIAVGHVVRDRDLSFSEGVYVVDLTARGDLRSRLEPVLAEQGFRPVDPDDAVEEPDSIGGKYQIWLPDEESLHEALKIAEVGFGAVIEDDPETGERSMRYLMPDLLPERTARTMALAWDDALSRDLDGRQSRVSAVKVERIGPQSGPPAPLGHSFVPLFLFGEAFLVGIWLGAVLLFTERSAGTVHALAVSPAGVRGMLSAKSAALVIVVTFEVVLTVVGVWGWHSGLLGGLAAALLLLGQALGVAFLCAGFFQSLTAFTMAGVSICFVATLPVMSFFSATFPDLWWMPTYPLYRAMRESFFSSGRPELVLGNLVTGAVFAGTLLALGARVYRRRLVHA